MPASMNAKEAIQQVQLELETAQLFWREMQAHGRTPLRLKQLRQAKREIKGKLRRLVFRQQITEDEARRLYVSLAPPDPEHGVARWIAINPAGMPHSEKE